jgi:DNA-binding transcriptional LysR family regulator
VNLGGIDLNLLPVLDALLIERSVTRAARRVGLSQPATSHALARLRAIIGDPLLVRTPRGMMPTARAQALVGPVREALSIVGGALASAPPFDPARVRRRFFISASDYAEFVLLPRLVAALARAAPGVEVWAQPFKESWAADLARGDVDVVVAPLRGLGDTQGAVGVRAQQLFEDRFVCVMRRAHPLATKKLTLERFARADHALVAPRGKPGGVVDDVLAAHGLERRVVVAVPHFLVAPYILAETDLILTVAERVARAMVRGLPLVLVAPPLPVPGLTMSLLWHERQDADPGLAYLRAELELAARATTPRQRRRAPGNDRTERAVFKQPARLRDRRRRGSRSGL